MSRPMAEPLEVRRKRILTAARTVLIQRGYRDVLLDDVARRADLAKGTLYLYFRSKQQLFKHVLEDLFDRLEARMSEIVDDGSTLEYLRRMAEEELDFAEENHDFLSQFCTGASSSSGSNSGKELRERFRRHLHFIGAKLQAAADEGVIRSHDAETGSLYFISLVRMFMVKKNLGLGPTPLRHQAPALIELFLHGLGKEK